jgi:hypothetical protein
MYDHSFSDRDINKWMGHKYVKQTRDYDKENIETTQRAVEITRNVKVFTGGIFRKNIRKIEGGIA